MALMEPNAEAIKRRNDRMKTKRSTYEPTWKEIADYEFPLRSSLLSGKTPGSKQTTQIYDSTAIHANEQLAAAIHGTLTPSGSQWLNLNFRYGKLSRLYEVQRWLEICSEMLMLAFSHSNFSTEIHEVDLDLPAFGTGCLRVQERPVISRGFNGLEFKSFPPGSYCVEEAPGGKVDTLFREFEWTARQAYTTWGERCSGRIIEDARNEPERTHQFLHATYPSEGEVRKPFASVIVDVKESRTVGRRGYWEFPYMVPKWARSSGEIYGRGPGHTALPDVKTLNKAKELGLKSWAKAIDPPTFETDDGVVGSLRMSPGARNVVKSKDSIFWFESKARFDVEKIKAEDLRAGIRDIYYIDKLQLREGPQMTALEVHVRYSLMQQVLGPTVGRFETELLDPMVARAFMIMLRTGALPPIPAVVRRYYGINNLAIEYEGPLSKSQRMGEVVAIQRLGTMLADLIAVNPEIMDNFDTDEMARSSADALGVPVKMKRSMDEVRKIRAERREKQEEEKQKIDLERMAEGAGKAAPALKLLTEVPEGERGAT